MGLIPLGQLFKTTVRREVKKSVEAGCVDVMKADIQRAGWTESKNDKINDRKFKVRHN